MVKRMVERQQVLDEVLNSNRDLGCAYRSIARIYKVPLFTHVNTRAICQFVEGDSLIWG